MLRFCYDYEKAGEAQKIYYSEEIADMRTETIFNRIDIKIIST